MLPVLLVDADPENIRNFRAHIKAAYPDMRVVGAFSDGARDILAYIHETAPQLIIADIRFFGGVRFMRFKDIHDAFPDMRFIVYGTFNDADYMKRAREFGVLDFIYRPVKPAELNRCLAAAAEHFKKAETSRAEQRLLEQSYQERLFQYEELFLRALLDGHLVRESEIRGGFSYFDMPFGTGYAVILFRVDHFRQITLTLTEMEKHMLVFKLRHITAEAFRDTVAQIFVRGFNEVAVLLGGKHTVEEKVALADAVKTAAYEQGGTRVTAGIGRTYDSPGDIAVSCREADAAFRHRHRMGYHSVIPIEFVEPGNTVTYRYPAAREDVLVHTVLAGNHAYSLSILNELFSVLAGCEPLPDGLVRQVVMTVVFRVSRYLTEQRSPVAAEVPRAFPTGEILTLSSLPQGRAFLETGFTKLCAAINRAAETDAAKLHAAAREYVRAHYAENFSAARAAVALGSTPERLNKVFLERERMMLFDFVMWARVYEAQNLLSQTDLDEEAIAVKVGFEDVKYFRSVFKKYNGDAPGDYRTGKGM